MNQIIQGAITKSYEELSKEKVISFSFPLKGQEKLLILGSLIKRVYRKSFLHDFYNVLTAKVN